MSRSGMDTRSASTRASIRHLSTATSFSIARRIWRDARSSQKNAPRWSKLNRIDLVRKVKRRKLRVVGPVDMRMMMLRNRNADKHGKKERIENHEDDHSIDTLCGFGIRAADWESDCATGSDAG